MREVDVGHAGRVLLAEDAGDFVQAVLPIFGDAGYLCDTVPTIETLLERLRDQPYDILIASLELPENQGLGIVRQARQIAPALPVLVTTADPSLQTAIEAVECSVNAYLPKPIEPGMLLESARQVLQKSSPHRALAQVVDTLRRCVEDLDEVRARAVAGVPVSVPEMSLRRLNASLLELMKLQGTIAGPSEAAKLCNHISCPHWPLHEAVFREVIRVLQETKRRFKSKELAELRQRLDQHLGISAGGFDSREFGPMVEH